jgi:DNA invertase Pin-like site-specific DNA recombinase
VSTDEQARSGAGLAAQRRKIRDEADRRDWTIEWVIDDGFSARDLHRPALTEGLQRLAAGEARALVAAKLDRLSRSVLDFASLLETAEKQGWGLVLLDLDLDTTKPTGRLVAHVMSAVAEFERQRIAERTREALAAVQARGVKLGRPRQLPDRVASRIRNLHTRGHSLQEIARRLNRDQVPTAHGGRQWWASTVRAVLAR